MSTLQINDFVKEVGENNVQHGFRDNELKPSDFVALIHSEVSEILEEFRKGKLATETYYRENGKPEGVPSELADTVQTWQGVLNKGDAMKRKFCILSLSLFIISSVLTGCSDGAVSINVENSSNMSSNKMNNMVDIGGDLVYDSATRIVYIENYTGYGTAFTAYFAPNGKPYRYNPETNTLEEIAE